MAELPSVFLPHQVEVQRYAGTSGVTEVYDAPLSLRCQVVAARTVVPTDTGYQTVAGWSIVSTRTELDQAGLVDIPARSKVRGWFGAATVQSVQDASDGGLGAWQHFKWGAV